MLKYLTALFLVFYAGTSVGQHLRDTVYFYRGQMLLGEVLSLSEGRLTLDSDDAGTVNIKYYKVKTFSAGIHYYRIRTVDSKILYGRINSSKNDGFIEILSSDGKIELSIDNITQVQRFDDSFWERLSGSVSAGYNYTKSSNIGRVNLGANMKYLAPKAEISFLGNTIMTQSDGSLSRDTENMNINLIVYLDYKWFFVAQFNYQRNLELSLLRRYQEYLGMGYVIFQRKDVMFMTSTGFAVSQELSTEGTESGSLWELPLILIYDLYKFQSPDIQFSLRENLYYGLTQKGRVRSDTNISLMWEPLTDFNIGLTFYTNYDSRPPDDGSNTFDFGTVLSLGYKFN